MSMKCDAARRDAHQGLPRDGMRHRRFHQFETLRAAWNLNLYGFHNSAFAHRPTGMDGRCIEYQIHQSERERNHAPPACVPRPTPPDRAKEHKSADRAHVGCRSNQK